MAMNFDTESGLSGKAAGGGGRRAAGWIKSLALILAGIVLGIGGWRVLGDIQEGHRFRQARQKAELLLREAQPQTGARLEAIARQLEDLESDVTQASLATSPAAIDVNRLRLQQRRLGLQLAEVERALRNVSGFIEQAPQRLALRPEREVLGSEQQQVLADFEARFDRCRRDYETLGPEIELAKGRRLQLAAMEAESGRRAQTEAESVQRAQAEALRVQADAIERTRAEAAQQASLETVREAQSDLTQLASLRVLQGAVDPPACRQVVQPLVVYPNPALVIGSSYPDRFLGYRTCGPSYYGYGGGYGPWRGGYGYGYAGYRCPPYRGSAHRGWW
jgi:hypothetical protein